MVYDFLSRRSQGENALPQEVQAAYPDLMPELADALLEGSRKLQLLMDAGRRAAHQPPDEDESQLFPPRFPNYTVIRELSGGGQGTVFEAIHDITGRRLAIKAMVNVSRHSVARFAREAEALAVLDHPGIVKIIDRGRNAQGVYFLVMDLVRGQPLDHWVDSQRAFTDATRRVMEMFAKLADAIAAAHQKGIVHRDLKPSNLLVDSLALPHVLDFGLASLSDFRERTLTTAGNIIGSLPWASPEQAAGTSDQAVAASDVYSLGVLMYHSLTGRFPYPVDGPLLDVVKSICTREPKDPRQLSETPFKIDEGLSQIVLRCLAKSPAERPENAGALAEMLRQYLAGHYRPGRRKTTLWTKAAVLAAMAASTAGVAAWRSGSSEVPSLYLKLPSIQNSIGMELIEVPAGTFRMGTTADDLDYQENEQAHHVQITRPFYLGKTEVTRAQYQAVMGELPRHVPADQSLTVPVENVTRDEAIEFCRRLSTLERREYRLPTEAEWEYACRSGTQTSFAGTGRIEDVAWYIENAKGQLQPVATRLPNQWGFFDMHGNVKEWIADGYVARLGHQDAINPLRGAPEDSGVARGGGASSDAGSCRSAARSARDPVRSVGGVGFRVVLVPESPQD